MKQRRRKTGNIVGSVWGVVGVIVLVSLLILWLTIADLWGDTDVNMILL